MTHRPCVQTGLPRADIDRRRFLHVVASFAAVAAASGCRADPGTDAADLARPELIEALGAERVHALGRRYREMVPAERAVEPLRDAIARAQPWSARLPWKSPSPAQDLVHRDFEVGRTVTVDGWILSVTEARQCALFSLLPA